MSGWRLAGLVLLLAGLSALRCPWAGEDADYLRGRQLYTLQEYKLAAETLTKYLASYPHAERAGAARLLLAESYYQLKEFAQAAPPFERVLADEPASPRRAEVLQRLVKVCYLSRDYAKSVAHADTFLKETRPRLGQTGAPPGLAALFESVLYYAGESAYALKNAAAARGYWDALRRDFPQSKLLPDAAEGLGWIAFEAGRYDEALTLFLLTAATPAHPKAALCQVLAARTLERLNKPDEALAALDKVAALTGAPEQAREVALWRAAFLLHAKRYPQAVAAYRALVKDFAAHADTPAPVAEAAALLLDGGPPGEALELADLYLASFAQGADRPRVARLKARALAGLKRPGEARTAAQAALKEADACPAGERKALLERPAALMLLAELSGAEGRTYYETVVKDHAASRFAAAARYQLAYLAGIEGRLDDGLARAEALLKDLPPAAPESAELRPKALFAAADFAFRKDDLPRAETYLKEYAGLPAVQADPAGSQLGLVLLREAWCRYKAKDPAAAEQLLDAGLAGGPQGALRQEMLYLRGLARLPDGDGPAAAGARGLEDFTALAKEAPDAEFTAYAALRAAQWLAARDAAAALPWLDRLVDHPAFAKLALRADGLLLRARLRYAARSYAEALADAEALLAHPEVKDRAPAARLLKALALEALPAKTAEAEAALTELLHAGPAEAPEVRQALRRRAQLRFQAKRYDEAQTDLVTFLKGREPQVSAPEDLEATLLLAACKKELKDAAGAQALLEKLAKLELPGALAFEVPFQLGNLAYEAGKHADAAKLYRQGLDAAAKVKDLPREPVAAAWLNLAWSCRRAGQTGEAEAAFGKLLEFDPAGPFSAEARGERAHILAETGKLDEALASWRELLERTPTDPLAERAQFEMAAALSKAKRFAEGATAFEQYLAKYPQAAGAREALCGLAECRLQGKQPDAAKAGFLKVLGPKGAEAELDELGERALLGLAEVALTQAQADEAKKLALRVIIDRPDSKWLDAALYLCGRASEGLNEPERAIGYYRKLLTDRPGSPRAEAARDRLKALGAPAP